MKLSRTGWNNVIIISVMAMILLINVTNNQLFPKDEDKVEQINNQQRLLSEHAVILSFAIADTLLIKRNGSLWQMQNMSDSNQYSIASIDHLMTTWQQSEGLVQASEIEIAGLEGTTIIIELAGVNKALHFTLYGLSDQLLIHKHQTNTWLAFPPQLYTQLIPINNMHAETEMKN